MFQTQVAYYINSVGIISMFLLQCRPFFVKYLSKHFSIIKDSFEIRNVYKQEISSLLMLFLTFLEFLSMLQIYIEMNIYPFLCSLLTGGLTTFFMIYEISYDVIINFYTYGLTPKERHLELLCNTIKEKQKLQCTTKTKMQFNSNGYNFSILQIEGWEKMKNSEFLKDLGKTRELKISNDFKKTKKWTKYKNNSHDKNKII